MALAYLFAVTHTLAVLGLAPQRRTYAAFSWLLPAATARMFLRARGYGEQRCQFAP